MKFVWFFGPKREKHYYQFQDLGVLVEIESITPKDVEGLKDILIACLETLMEVKE